MVTAAKSSIDCCDISIHGEMPISLPTRACNVASDIIVRLRTTN
jgi:hypothetical protein